MGRLWGEAQEESAINTKGEGEIRSPRRCRASVRSIRLMSENLPHRSASTTPMQAEPWEGELPSRLVAAVPEGVIACLTYLGQHFVEVRSDAVLRVLAFLRDAEQFDFLTDLTAVDRAHDPGRFEIVYCLYSFAHNQRLRVKTHASLDQEPVSAFGSGIQKQARRTIVVGDQNVHASVIVHISEYRRPADLAVRQRWAGRSRDISEALAFPQVAQQQISLSIRIRVALF